jgi:hypothetical protein
MLFIDHGSGKSSRVAGTWSYGDENAQDIRAVFLARRQVRRLYAEDYAVNPEAPMICASWDGMHAYGRGGRDPKAPIQERECCTRTADGRMEILCSAARWSKEEWLCPPQDLYLLMVLTPKATCWMPAFFLAKGKSVAPTFKAYEAAKMMSARTSVLVDGRAKAKWPTYAFGCDLTLAKPDPRWNAYAPIFGRMDLLPEDDVKFVHSFACTVGLEMWNAEIDRLREEARRIGPDDVGAEPAKIDVDVMPF